MQVGLPRHSYPSGICKHVVICASVLLACSLIQYSKTKIMFCQDGEYIYIFSGKVYYENVAIQTIMLCIDRKFSAYIMFNRNPNLNPFL